MIYLKNDTQEELVLGLTVLSGKTVAFLQHANAELPF